jgi:septum site-determining protein MinD
VIGLVEAAGKPSPKLILNRMKPELVACGDMIDTDDVLDVLRIEILAVVPEDPTIVAATNRGEPVVMRDGTLAGQAFKNAAARIEGEEVPLMQLTPSQTGVLERLSGWLRVGAD